MLGTLTEPELMELTGKKRRASQIEELQAMRVRFLVRSDGSLVVARAHVDAQLGVSSAPTKKEPELRL